MALNPADDEDMLLVNGNGSIEDATTTNTTNDPMDIDESLYSRQLYVFGHEAQRKMAQSSVLIVGLGGLGIEIAKNIVLAGVKAVGLLDHKLIKVRDLGSQFYCNHNDIGKERALVSLPHIQSLNQYVNVEAIESEFSLDFLGKSNYQVVVLTESLWHDAIPISAYCHNNGIKCIVANVNGLAASVFVDVGENHVISDKDGEQPARGLISNITRNDAGIVTTHEQARHGMVDGDYVTFEEVEGMVELNDSKPRPIKVINAYSFSIENTTDYSEYTGQGYYQQVKPSTTIKHCDLSYCIKHGNEKVITDISGHSVSLHYMYDALSEFYQSTNALPNSQNIQHAKSIALKAQEKASQAQCTIDTTFIRRLVRCADAVICPMAACIGGIVGQEVLKACSGKFTPLNQLWYYDAYEALPDEKGNNDDDNISLDQYKPQNSRYDDQITIFGADIQEKIQDLCVFLVGAGAIGCEMLKNWALMGIATNDNGMIHLTDMDAIERSNLNRQFLFRTHDVGSLKSETAAREIVKMNSNVHIDARRLKVGQDTEEIYNDDFWDDLHLVCTALDNVDARLYVDQRCVYYLKPMIDSGTLGTKANTQVVIPMLTESYGSSRDPPEESIPICTLKNFPNKIEHTIQWARDWFEGNFKQAPENVNNYLQHPNYLTDIAKQPQIQLLSLQSAVSLLVDDRPLSFDECVHWARHQFEKEFNHAIKQMLNVFPEDTVTASGAKFWSGTKRAPCPIDFDPLDRLHMDFIVACANLRAYNYGLRGERDRDKIAAILRDVVVSEWKPIKMKIAATDEEAKELEEQRGLVDDHDEKVEELKQKLPSPQTLAGYKLYASEFEKDDDTNFHMDFITACSNLRARNYRVKEVTKHQTKQIAGKIIPAIATTTALVTGLVCLELYKVLLKKPLESYRNSYVNLALPLFTASEPFEPARQKAQLKDRGEWSWSLWDRIEVDIGDVSLQEFINHFKDAHGLYVNMLSYGPSMLYYDFGGPPKKKMLERLQMPMTNVVETVGKKPLKACERYLVLEACVTNEDDDDVEIPFIRFKFR